MVKLTFPVAVLIDQVYAADVDMSAVDTETKHVYLKLGLTIPADRRFQLQGRSKVKMDKRIHITCLGVTGPPPSPPHSIDCDLGVRYMVTNTWEKGASVMMDFQTWDPGRELTLTFWGEEAITLKDLRGARIVGANANSNLDSKTALQAEATSLTYDFGDSYDTDKDGEVVEKKEMETVTVKAKAKVMNQFFFVLDNNPPTPPSPPLPRPPPPPRPPEWTAWADEKEKAEEDDDDEGDEKGDEDKHEDAFQDPRERAHELARIERQKEKDKLRDEEDDDDDWRRRLDQWNQNNQWDQDNQWNQNNQWQWVGSPPPPKVHAITFNVEPGIRYKPHVVCHPPSPFPLLPPPPEPPVPPPSPPSSPPSPTCLLPWCPNHSQLWETKCGWWQCTTCPICLSAPLSPPADPLTPQPPTASPAFNEADLSWLKDQTPSPPPSAAVVMRQQFFKQKMTEMAIQQAASAPNGIDFMGQISNSHDRGLIAPVSALIVVAAAAALLAVYWNGCGRSRSKAVHIPVQMLANVREARRKQPEGSDRNAGRRKIEYGSLGGDDDSMGEDASDEEPECRFEPPLPMTTRM